MFVRLGGRGGMWVGLGGMGIFMGAEKESLVGNKSGVRRKAISPLRLCSCLRVWWAGRLLRLETEPMVMSRKVSWRIEKHECLSLFMNITVKSIL